MMALMEAVARMIIFSYQGYIVPVLVLQNYPKAQCKVLALNLIQASNGHIMINHIGWLDAALPY